MPPKILRRCTICKKFHASYLVEDREFGKCYLCLSCWKVRQANAKLVEEKKRVTSAT
jgi:hypothetical protein